MADKPWPLATRPWIVLPPPSGGPNPVEPIEPYATKFYSQAIDEHTALVEAIVGGRVDDAGVLAREHFTMSARTLRAVISRGAGETVS